MDRTRFMWLANPTADAMGRRLETGELYAVAEFDAGAVAAWIETGAAKYEETKPKRQSPKATGAEE